MTATERREPTMMMRQQEHEWYGPRIVDEELGGLIERMQSRGYLRLCETIGLWNVSLTLTSGIKGYRWSWRSRVVGLLHRAIDLIAEHPKEEPLLHRDQFDEIDKLSHLIKGRPTVPAERGWNVSMVWNDAHGVPCLRHEPVVAWVIDVLGAIPVTVTGVHPDYDWLRRPDGTYTERMILRYLSEDQVIEEYRRDREWASEQESLDGDRGGDRGDETDSDEDDDITEGA